MKKSIAITLAGLIAVAIAAGVVLGPSVSANPAPPPRNRVKPNLIVNGSFETGPQFEGSFKPIDENSVELRGWVITRGQIDLLQVSGGKQKAAHGKRSLDLHGSPGLGGVKQQFATKIGKKYKLTFSMSGNPGVGHEKVQMAVRAAGKKEELEGDMTGKTLDDLKWQKKTWEFIAVDKITVLELHTAMAPTSNAFGGPLLDDVKVVAVD